MEIPHPTEHMGRVEEAVSGRIVDAGPDHLTVRDQTLGEDVTVRTDDTTHFTWHDPLHRGLLTDNGEVKVGYFLAGGVHKAAEVVVLDPGDGESIAELLVSAVH